MSVNNILSLIKYTNRKKERSDKQAKRLGIKQKQTNSKNQRNRPDTYKEKQKKKKNEKKPKHSGIVSVRSSPWLLDTR